MTLIGHAFLRLLLLVFLAHQVICYNTNTCCELAKEKDAFINSSVEPICAQTYSPTLSPAQPAYVNYTFCSSRCRGVQLSKASTPSEWAAPIVQFILPSVIFSMTIPRRKKIEFDYMFDFRWPRTGWAWFNSLIQLAISLVLFLIILVPVIIDTLLWISFIIVGAGNMLVSGLYEAHLDYRLVKYVRELENDEEEALKAKTELLVTITSGNLSFPADEQGHGRPLKHIVESLTTDLGDSKQRDIKLASRLLNLLGAQSSFGGVVGSPVLFYLGAFIYTILDLRNNPSSQDAAISLGFGIEWMIIVHVAIVSGCLLASNNPNTCASIVGSGHEALQNSAERAPTIQAIQREGDAVRLVSPKEWKAIIIQKILGWRNVYETDFQPVGLAYRGTNKMLWIKESDKYKDAKFRKVMEITRWGWLIKIFLPALALIVLPPATGGIVAYYTPPKGIACRSLSFVIYASCQVASTFIALVRCAVETKEKESWRRYLFTGWRFCLLSSTFWIGSFAAGVLGTTLQIVGVYRTCICYAGASNWYNLNKINPLINLATDTALARDASKYWIWMGTTATVFMALNCYIGFWYQRLIRHRFTDAVVEMYNQVKGVELKSLHGNKSGPSGSSKTSQTLSNTEIIPVK